MNAWNNVLLYDHTIDYYLPEKTRLEYSIPNYWMSLKQTNQRTFKKYFNNHRKLSLIQSKGIYQMSKTAIDEIACKMLESLWFNLVNSYCLIGGYIPLYEYVA